jgi:hypothetical protein
VKYLAEKILTVLQIPLEACILRLQFGELLAYLLLISKKHPKSFIHKGPV